MGGQQTGAQLGTAATEQVNSNQLKPSERAGRDIDPQDGRVCAYQSASIIVESDGARSGSRVHWASTTSALHAKHSLAFFTHWAISAVAGANGDTQKAACDISERSVLIVIDEDGTDEPFAIRFDVGMRDAASVMTLHNRVLGHQRRRDCERTKMCWQICDAPWMEISAASAYIKGVRARPRAYRDSVGCRVGIETRNSDSDNGECHFEALMTRLD